MSGGGSSGGGLQMPLGPTRIRGTNYGAAQGELLPYGEMYVGTPPTKPVMLNVPGGKGAYKKQMAEYNDKLANYQARAAIPPQSFEGWLLTQHPSVQALFQQINSPVAPPPTSNFGQL